MLLWSYSNKKWQTYQQKQYKYDCNLCMIVIYVPENAQATICIQTIIFTQNIAIKPWSTKKSKIARQEGIGRSSREYNLPSAEHYMTIALQLTKKMSSVWTKLVQISLKQCFRLFFLNCCLNLPVTGYGSVLYVCFWACSFHVQIFQIVVHCIKNVGMKIYSELFSKELTIILLNHFL